MQPPLQYRGVNFTEYELITDQSYLKTLAICHYVWGGLTMALGCIGLIYIAMGIAAIYDPKAFQSGSNPPPPRLFAAMFLGMGSCMSGMGWGVGLMTIFSGRCIAKQKHRLFSQFVAGFNCLSIPIGTVLGVFTFMVLSRPAVRMLYDGQVSTASIAPPPPPRV